MKGICPLCGKPNGCAIVAKKDPKTCWCIEIKVPQSLRDKIPEESRMKSCVCKECILEHNSQE